MHIRQFGGNVTPTVFDQFCGAGGSSVGARRRGLRVMYAVNHWDRAVESHSANFPDTYHDCADLSKISPARYDRTDVLITSPECFPAGTLILAARGLIPIENMQAGDMVLTHRNRWMPVTSVMRKTGDTVILTGQGHRALEVTREHPFFTRTQMQVRKDGGYQRAIGDPTWITADSLVDQTTRWASPFNVASLPIPTVSGVNRRSATFSADFWWMIGRWLGDGLVRLRQDNGHNEISICCGKHKVAELEAHLNFAPRTLKHASGDELHWRKREMRTAYMFECGHDSLAAWIAEHFGKGAHGKTIPSWALSMPLEWREALLEGYVSGDGYRNDRTTSAASVSKSLALGVRMLVGTLGYHASFGCYRHKAGAIEGRPFEAYDMWAVRWENNRSQRTGIIDGEHLWTLVKNVRHGRIGIELYNLSVADDESYVADGIVVHNCTAHSLASGKKSAAQCDLFGEVTIDPAAERSRATAWDVVNFAEVHRYNAIIVENVPQFRQWVLFPQWLKSLEKLGYDWQTVYINAMFAHQRPTAAMNVGDFVPQSRDRMFIVLWKHGMAKPDLNFHPQGFCQHCGKDVETIQSWKREGLRWGAYGERRQYVYRCPVCAGIVKPYFFAAANIIDWNIPMERIGDRKRPLKPMTMQRIQAGMDKFWGTFTINTSYTHGGDRARHVSEPLYTQDTRQSQGLVLVPAFVSMRDTNRGHYQVQLTSGALPTQVATAIQQWLIAAPVQATDAPTGAILPAENAGLLAAPFLAQLRNHQTAVSVGDVMGTITAGGNHHALVMPYYSNGTPKPAEGAAPTVTTVDRLGLLIAPEAPPLEDCLFRMLTPHECQLAQSFPSNYIVLGTNREKVKQIGNANPPVLMDALLERVAAVLQ